MGRFPTQDLTERILRNGGKIPYGLFRPNMMRVRKGRPPAADDLVDRVVKAMRAMLRDLTNINVRQPSHMAPPFRAVQWISQIISIDGSVTAGIIPINGNDAVSPGSIAVMSWLSYSVTPDIVGTNFVPAWGESGATPLTLQVLRNGLPLPGLNALLPSYTLELDVTTGANRNHQSGGPPPVPIIPVTLQPGDTLSFTLVPTIVGTMYLQFAGYSYPTELEGDGVRGTLADRG